MAQPVTTARHISGAGTFLVHSGPGTLWGININTAGTLITAYDNVAGSGSIIASWGPSTVGFFDFGLLPLGKGLTFVTTGTPDITAIFKD
jgi:hypothetical protein